MKKCVLIFSALFMSAGIAALYASEDVVNQLKVAEESAPLSGTTCGYDFFCLENKLTVGGVAAAIVASTDCDEMDDSTE